MNKIILGFALISLLAACGGQQQQSVGLIEETKLILRGEQLVGLSISIGEDYRSTIQEADLTPYEFGVLGAKDGIEERLQAVVVKLDEGNHRVKVAKQGNPILDKEMYFSKGQTRELRIRQ